MLKVWGRRNSQNVQKVMWLIGELGLAHEHTSAGGKYGGLDTEAFRAMNPHGRVPVIKDGDVVVWESQAILRYLAATYSVGRFWPEAPKDRAMIDAWMDWSQSTLQPAFLGGIFMGYFRTPEPRRNWEAINQAVEVVGQLFQLLDRQLEGKKFLLGEELTLADIPVACNFYRYFEIDLPKPDMPNVTAYYERLKMRPAYRQHVMVSFEELRGVATAR
jgi:glutathione S-transferase